MSEKITIGGRTFRGLRCSSLAHDIWLTAELRKAGLDPLPARQPEESAEGHAWRLLSLVHASGRLYELLGALIVPDDVQDLAWTPKLAAETGRFIGALWREADKQAARRLVADLLFPFLRDAIGCLPVSRGSGAPGARETAALAAVARLVTATGDPCSRPSAPGIASGSGGCCDGRLATS